MSNLSKDQEDKQSGKAYSKKDILTSSDYQLPMDDSSQEGKSVRTDPQKPPIVKKTPS